MKRWLLLALVALAGCRTTEPNLPYHELLENDVGHFTLELAEADPTLEQSLSAAIAQAGPALAAWGHLDAPVSVVVLADHQALARVIGHGADPAIRAWTTYDRLFLQAPSTWPPNGASQAQLDETVTHELTHALMFQLAADSATWRARAIPFWFREGMATFTAQQGYLFPSLEDLARELDEHPLKDPVRDGGPLSIENYRLAYGAAHQAFTFLVHRYGEGHISSLLARMKKGARFDDAFQAELDLTVDAFVKDFETYLRFRGFFPGRLNTRPGKGKEDGT